MANKELIVKISSPNGKVKEEVKLFYSDDGIPVIKYASGETMTVMHKSDSIWGIDIDLNVNNYTFTYRRNMLVMSCFKLTEPDGNRTWPVEEKSAMKLVELMARM